MQILKQHDKIFCGDCVEVLSSIPEDVVDLVVTSPPYDDIRDYSKEFIAAFDKTVNDFDESWTPGAAWCATPQAAKKYKQEQSKFVKEQREKKIEKHNNYSFPFEDIARQLYRVMKKGSVLVWVVGDAVKDGSETGSSFRQALYFMSLGFKLHDTMIYMKNGSSFPAGRGGNRYSQIFEYMFVFSKDGKPKTANLICDKKNKWSGWVSFGKQSMRGPDGKLVERTTKPVPEFSPRNNIWKIYAGKGFSTKDDFAFEHPAIFPESLVEDNIVTWSNPNDVVLDPFCGSGTTLKMSRLNKRKYIGIDISFEYCKIAKKRVKVADKLLKDGYKYVIKTSARNTITSDNKLSHKEISDISNKEKIDILSKWQDELYELRKLKGKNK